MIIVTGVVFGLGAVLLVKFGNPGNYGFCAACQLRDIAGAVGLHNTATLQYARPEILGFVLGAFGLSRAGGEFRARGGSSPLVRFVLGMAMMLGALVFLGCPLRAILRVAGGDLNGITALAGFIAGIGAGILFLKRGFNLGRAYTYTGGSRVTGYLAAAAALILLIGVSMEAGFLHFSVQGPGSMHAPVILSLVAGLAGGVLAWRTRMCLSGGFRDFMLAGDTSLLKIYGVMFAAALAGNLYFGFFKLGFANQPLAHTMHIWNFLGLFLTGLAATLAGGCPLRQLILSGEGSTDAMFCVLGMLAGAGIAHNLNAAGSAAGVGINGQIAVIAGIAVVAGIGCLFREKLVPAGKGV
ncbi:putative selenium metabolism protein, YedE family [Sporomusa termitida]|uniref:Putative selenium metabolism protein, YedE family n=1 Tax=Sporomusa termitida TaxID=2377 RepID=A0A517DVQ1_9FIRM|nr:putative selenium metabolism protein, YedE family [Sporomusa termitida]